MLEAHEEGVQRRLSHARHDDGRRRRADDHIAGLLRAASEKPIWLVFYTHDVSARPSLYGCTPATLERVVQCVAAAGIRILTVGDAAAAVIGR